MSAQLVALGTAGYRVEFSFKPRMGGWCGRAVLSRGVTLYSTKPEFAAMTADLLAQSTCEPMAATGGV